MKRQKPLYDRGEIKSHDAPWYEDVTSYLTNAIYGPRANAQDYSWMDKLSGPQNPLNLPAQISQGVDTATAGYNAGNYSQMGAGALQAGLAASPLMGARAMMPSVRNAAMARNKMGMHPNETTVFSGKAQPRLDDFAIMRNASNPRQATGRPLYAGNDSTPLPGMGGMTSGVRETPAIPESTLDFIANAPISFQPKHMDAAKGVFRSSSGATIPTKDAYERYASQMAAPLPEHAFHQMMGNLGYQKAKVSGRVRYIGIE